MCPDCALCLRPAYFGGYLNANYEYLVQTQDVSAQQIRDLACNGFQASFLSDNDKQRHIQSVHRVYDEVMAG